MKPYTTKPTTEAVTAVEAIATTKDSHNLVLLRCSPLPSPSLSTTLLSAPKKSPPQSPSIPEREREEREMKSWIRYVGATE
jgi:hypothetical protein